MVPQGLVLTCLGPNIKTHCLLCFTLLLAYSCCAATPVILVLQHYNSTLCIWHCVFPSRSGWSNTTFCSTSWIQKSTSQPQHHHTARLNNQTSLTTSQQQPSHAVSCIPLQCSVGMIKPLQIMMVHLIFNQPKRAHITPLLISLHWLPVEANITFIKFKALTVSLRTSTRLAPSCFKAFLKVYVPSSVVSKWMIPGVTRTFTFTIPPDQHMFQRFFFVHNCSLGLPASSNGIVIDFGGSV